MLEQASPSSKATWGAVGFMVLLGMLRMVLHKFFLPRYPTFLYRTETFLNKHLLLASTVGKHGMERVRLLPGHGELQKWTTIHIPVRAHTLAIGAWSLVNFVLLFTPYWHVVSSALADLGGVLLTPVGHRNRTSCTSNSAKWRHPRD